ncbi:MAG: hypothetical protein A2845_00090 [Candidatus Lloydbacteria bacterium RIFCSPHIGHO2_01_FULL_49_22]|uniref:Homing endonuclease LAGLIDADG domain-containing protein n=1 Tax=Candidatus Lloydbacteria bacterium RIFCSPHIGHO2_01_FULL_49_22 TaxID=1798658 RepID=A0A1G2CVT3_9BACT|nr:MAG: hypothetical protein A2845_00090 [Candidatus Lloydbacteria bacterium RIFCSPHIGHO2_01_FULL_49_22]
MPRKNACSADNQQERLKTIGWIVGYVDGEGCFSVSLFKNKTTRFGWQVFPEFVVTQGEKSKKSLVILKNFFNCGKIYVNKRQDNHNENIYRYCVRSRKELTEIIIPFFRANNPRTAKNRDFNLFAKIVDMMSRNVHSKRSGMTKIAKTIEKMNHKKLSLFLESSETEC